MFSLKRIFKNNTFLRRGRIGFSFSQLDYDYDHRTIAVSYLFRKHVLLSLEIPFRPF